GITPFRKGPTATGASSPYGCAAAGRSARAATRTANSDARTPARRAPDNSLPFSSALPISEWLLGVWKRHRMVEGDPAIGGHPRGPASQRTHVRINCACGSRFESTGPNARASGGDPGDIDGGRLRGEWRWVRGGRRAVAPPA